VSFELPDERYWALVGFQADWRMARSGIVNFTVNLTVTEKSEWEATRKRKLYYPKRPSPNSSYGMNAEVIRIGALLPVDEQTYDRWWTLDDDNTEAVAAEVIAAIRDYAVPWLRSRMASGDIREH
jgi:hypothetical protein